MKRLYPDLRITCSGAQNGMKGVHEYLMEQAGPHLDYVSIHSYALNRGNELPRHDYLTAVGTSGGPEAFIANVAGSLKRNGDPRIRIAYDEWNLRAWQHPGFPRNRVDDYHDPAVREWVEKRRRQNDQADQYTMADALFSASFLNACLRHSDIVTMANIAPLVNTRGPIFAHPKGIVKRPHYHALWMYANLLQDHVIDAKVRSGTLTGTPVSAVDAIATVDESGKRYSIALINRHPTNDVTCTVDMGGPPLDGAYPATLLTAESADTYNDIANPDRVAPKKAELIFKNGMVALPPHSLTIVQIPTGS